jgi:hypothetical protein
VLSEVSAKTEEGKRILERPERFGYDEPTRDKDGRDRRTVFHRVGDAFISGKETAQHILELNPK